MKEIVTGDSENVHAHNAAPVSINTIQGNNNIVNTD
jgi:hypothetical protein